MEKPLFVIALALITILGAILFFRRSGPQVQVCFENNCFKIEMAISPKERERGLMFRKSLEEDRGMLFVFETEGIYSFWMKNTLILLDIIWINEKKEIVFIKENAQPCQDDCFSFSPDRPAKYVLEIQGGMVKKIGLSLGDKLQFDIPK